mgnify:CR=1 FL=1
MTAKPAKKYEQRAGRCPALSLCLPRLRGRWQPEGLTDEGALPSLHSLRHRLRRRHPAA